jgi:hypothetical protein
MRNIVVTLHRAADLSGTMSAMRGWLNDHRCQPQRFTCDYLSGWNVIHVDFHEDEMADAFKAQFGGSEEKPARGSMSRVCWWRLMAEEIRTEADACSSASAKHSLLYAAQTLDRMASNMEQLLERNWSQMGLDSDADHNRQTATRG